MLGLRYDCVKLYPYSPEWVKLYKEEEAFLYRLLGDLAYDIQHIGSTSIKDMIAKPVIDIMITVRSQMNATRCIKPMIEAGYQYFGECGRVGRLFFVKGNEYNSTHHIHLVESDSKYYIDYILFRDYIRKNKDVADEYARRKQELAKMYEKDRNAYRISKSKFIEKVLQSVIKEICAQPKRRIRS